MTSPISSIPSPLEIMQSSRKESEPNEFDDSESVESDCNNTSKKLNSRFDALTSIALSQLSDLSETSPHIVEETKEPRRKNINLPHRTCCVINCKNNDSMNSLKFRNIQPPV